MNVLVKFVEVIWDNYQGGSGKPITRKKIIDVPNELQIQDVRGGIADVLDIAGHRPSCTGGSYQNEGILEIIILP